VLVSTIIHKIQRDGHRWLATDNREFNYEMLCHTLQTGTADPLGFYGTIVRPILDAGRELAKHLTNHPPQEDVDRAILWLYERELPIALLNKWNEHDDDLPVLPVFMDDRMSSMYEIEDGYDEAQAQCARLRLGLVLVSYPIQALELWCLVR
jgi:hypothetical protein